MPRTPPQRVRPLRRAPYPWAAQRGPLQNHFWKTRHPQPYWGGENSGNALEASRAFNQRVWGSQPYFRKEFQEKLWERFRGPKCSKLHDLIAIALCDSNRESQITSDLRHCEPSQKSPMFWLVVQEFGIAILMAIWTEVQITNRAIWKCDLSCSRQRFEGNSCDLGSAILNHYSDLRFVIWSTWLGREGIMYCRQVGDDFSSSVENCRKPFQQWTSDNHCLLSGKKKAQKRLTHKLAAQAVNPRTTSWLTSRKCLFSWFRRRTHIKTCLSG